MGIVGTLLVLLWLLLRSSFSSNQVAETHVSKIANVVKSVVVCCGGNRLSSSPTTQPSLAWPNSEANITPEKAESFATFSFGFGQKSHLR